MKDQVRIANDLARTLAETRAEVELLETHKKQTRALIDGSLIGRRFAGAVATLKSAKDAMRAQHQDLSAALVKLYEYVPRDNIEKHPATHQIRRPVEVIYNVDDAKEYCMERHPEFLALDKKKFEKFARESGADLSEFVELSEGLTVTIKSDLSEFLQ